MTVRRTLIHEDDRHLRHPDTELRVIASEVQTERQRTVENLTIASRWPGNSSGARESAHAESRPLRIIARPLASSGGVPRRNSRSRFMSSNNDDQRARS